MQPINTLTTAVILGILLAPLHNAIAGKLYRWTDEDGNVHYSDKVPADQARHARSRLDERGLELQRVNAAKTKEELAKEAELKRLQAEEKRLIAEQQAKDNVLLRTFRSEDDILMTRDGKLSSLDNSILIIRTNIRRLKLRLADMQKTAADRERRGKGVNKNMLRNIETTRKQLKDSYATIIKREQDKKVITEKYAADLTRFRELRHLQVSPVLDERKKARSLLLETVVSCTDENSCNEAWKLAEAYTRMHTTTRLQMLAKSIIMTAAPIRDKDISITVSRIREPDMPGARLFMDLQCKTSPRGKEFCVSDKVNGIRAGFRPYLGAKEPIPEEVSQETASVPAAPSGSPIHPGAKP